MRGTGADRSQTPAGIVSLLVLVLVVLGLVGFFLPETAPESLAPSSPGQESTAPRADAPTRRQCAAPSRPPATRATVPAGSGSDAASGAEAATARVVNVGFEDITSEDPKRLEHIAEQLDRVGATGVSIAVGRLDWVGFPWAGHDDVVSSEVAETGRDYVQEAIDALRCGSDGQAREIVLSIDTLFGRELDRDPGIAGRNEKGQRSRNWASLSAWRTGGLSHRLVDLAEEAVRRYSPDGINITELMFTNWSFGKDDLQDFRSFANASDWPRTADGAIDRDDERIWAWKSAAVTSVIADVGDALAGGSTTLTMDVRSPEDDDPRGRPQSGQNYGDLLKHVARLNIWDFPGVPSSGRYGAAVLAQRFLADQPDRFGLEIGLWKGDGTISETELEDELRTVNDEGVRRVAVTPTSLFTPRTWSILDEAWSGAETSGSPGPASPTEGGTR